MDNLNICFDKTIFYTYLFILGFFVCFTLYVYLYPKVNENSNSNPDLNLKQELMNEIQKVRAENSVQQREVGFCSPQPLFLDKIFNPLSGTSPMNPQGSFSNPRGYDGFREFQQLGYITGPNGRYPVMGRYKFSNNTDKYDLYTIDNERGRIKIPFKTKNDYLYDNDPVQIPELGGEFTFKQYENTDGNRYQPDIL